MPDKLGDRVRLLHIREAIGEIFQYVEEVTFDEFTENSMMRNACIRQLEIVGEACNRLSDEIKEESKQINWRAIIGLRNVLVHQYFGVDDKVIWDIIQNDLTELNQAAMLLLQKIESNK